MSLVAFTVVVANGLESLIVLVSFIILSIIGHILTKKSEKAERRSRARIVTYRLVRELLALKEKEQAPEEKPSKQEETETDAVETIEKRDFVSTVAQEHLESELDKRHLLTEVESHHLRLDIPDIEEGRRRGGGDPFSFVRRFPPAVQMVLFHELLSQHHFSHVPFCLHPSSEELTSNKGRRKGGEEHGVDE